MTGRRELTEFVRNTLGCACPDEVFERIEYEEGADGEGVLSCPNVRIGGRLLIGLWETNDPARIQSEMAEIVNAGKSERDRRGMNRFRLVIATDDLESVGRIAHGMFPAIAQKDDKIHLHVVSRQEAASLKGQSRFA